MIFGLNCKPFSLANKDCKNGSKYISGYRSHRPHSENFIAIIQPNRTRQKSFYIMPKPQLKNIEEHLQFLVEERNSFTKPDHLGKTCLYITKQYESFNFSVNLEMVDFENIRSFNIIGKPAEISSTSSVLATHYDTKSETPGADDNVNAMATLLKMACCLADHTFHAPLIFTIFTSEEYGFIGSRHFIENAITRSETLSGIISLEMLVYKNSAPQSQTYPPYVDTNKYLDSGDFIAVFGNEPSAQLTQSLAEGMKKHVPSLKVETLVIPGTGGNFSEVRLRDHAPFWNADIPGLMVTDTAFFSNPHYHQSTDTLETLDIEFIRENT
jgi:aminopeptidase YwaD